MADIESTVEAGRVSLEFDDGLYPIDAIYGASYIFIDRCYVKLDRPKPGRIAVTLKAKNGGALPLDQLAGEFENELLGQSWRRMILEENRQFIEQVTTQALSGAAGPPGLDDLLSMDIDEETAFEDPLGIAMSWEEKYKKKSKAADGLAPVADDEGESAAAKVGSPDKG